MHTSYHLNLLLPRDSVGMVGIYGFLLGSGTLPVFIGAIRGTTFTPRKQRSSRDCRATIADNVLSLAKVNVHTNIQDIKTIKTHASKMYLTPTAYSTSHLPLTMTSSTSEEEINGRTGSDKLFPGKLHDMLDHAEAEGLQHVVSWSPDGQSFTIHKPKQLIEILPMFFGHSKYRSFHRQLNMWSFRRLGEGPNRGAFTHPYFIKGQKAMCRTISRHRFRSVPTDTESTSDEHFQHNISTIRDAVKGIPRSPSQVSLESSTDVPTSKEEPSFQPFLRDGDVATFEGMPFHFVGHDIDIF